MVPGLTQLIGAELQFIVTFLNTTRAYLLRKQRKQKLCHQLSIHPMDDPLPQGNMILWTMPR